MWCRNVYIIKLCILWLLVDEIPAVITPSRSWDFRDCSSTTVMDSITNLWATLQGTATCTTDGVLMNGDTSGFVEVESFSWDGTSGVSFEV